MTGPDLIGLLETFHCIMKFADFYDLKQMNSVPNYRSVILDLIFSLTVQLYWPWTHFFWRTGVAQLWILQWV